MFTLSDYAKLNVSTEPKSYYIGINRKIRFFSDETTISVSIDCFIKFNNDDLWVPLYKNVGYWIFRRRLFRISFRSESGNGTIEIWSEGNIKR